MNGKQIISPQHHPCPKDHQSESGQNLIEFALVLGLIIVFVYGGIEIARLLQQKSDLDSMVRQAAQQAGEFGGGKTEVQAFIRKQMEYQGYSTSDINHTVDSLDLEVQQFNESTNSFDAPEDRDTCTYGEFITVKVQVIGRVNIPSFPFVTGVDNDSIILEVEKTNRCWRA